MTTVTIELPDDLAQEAARAGLLSGGAQVAAMRRLQSQWRQTPPDQRDEAPLTADALRTINQEVRRQRLA